MFSSSSGMPSTSSLADRAPGARIDIFGALIVVVSSVFEKDTVLCKLGRYLIAVSSYEIFGARVSRLRRQSSVKRNIVASQRLMFTSVLWQTYKHLVSSARNLSSS